MAQERGKNQNCIIVRDIDQASVLIRKSAVNEYIEQQGNDYHVSVTDTLKMLACSVAGLGVAQGALFLEYPGLTRISELSQGRQATTIAETDHITWAEPCYLVEFRGFDHIAELVTAVNLVTKDDASAAFNTLNSLLANPHLPLNAKADALGLMGLAVRWANDHEKAKPLLQEALSIGQSSGWALENLELQPVYADALADTLFQLAHGEFTRGRVSDAQAMLTNLEQIISKFKGQNKFNAIKHQGLLLHLQGIVLRQSKESKAALDKFQQLLQPHFCEYFKSKGQGFIIGIAYNNLAAIYLSSASKEKAIEALRSSLLYFDSQSEDAVKVRALLSEINGQKSEVTKESTARGNNKSIEQKYSRIFGWVGIGVGVIIALASGSILGMIITVPAGGLVGGIIGYVYGLVQKRRIQQNYAR